MKLVVDGREAYCYTGGKPFDPALPCVVFVHGASIDSAKHLPQPQTADDVAVHLLAARAVTTNCARTNSGPSTTSPSNSNVANAWA